MGVRQALAHGKQPCPQSPGSFTWHLLLPALPPASLLLHSCPVLPIGYPPAFHWTRSGCPSFCCLHRVPWAQLGCRFQSAIPAILLQGHGPLTSQSALDPSCVHPGTLLYREQVKGEVFILPVFVHGVSEQAGGALDSHLDGTEKWTG